MKNNKKLLLALTLIIISALAATSISYAFWLSSVKPPNDKDDSISVTIGNGTEATTTITLGSKTGLGTLNPGSDNKLTITVPVKWTTDNTDATGYTGTLSVVVDTAEGKSIKIGDDDTYKDLIVVTPDTPKNITINDTNFVDVTITVSLTEPENQTIYDAIKGKTVTIPLIFKVTSPTAPTGD